MKTKTKCLNPNCKDKPFCRGLCKNCYNSASRLIRLKRVTDKWLVKHGKLLRDGARSRINWLLSVD